MVAPKNHTKSTALAILGIALSQVAFAQMVRTDAAVSEKSPQAKSANTSARPPLRTPRVTVATSLKQATYAKDTTTHVTQNTTLTTIGKTADQKPPLNPYHRSAATPARWRRD